MTVTTTSSSRTRFGATRIDYRESRTVLEKSKSCYRRWLGKKKMILTGLVTRPQIARTKESRTKIVSARRRRRRRTKTTSVTVTATASWCWCWTKIVILTAIVVCRETRTKITATRKKRRVTTTATPSWCWKK